MHYSFLMAIIFKLINDNWGHATGDKVLIEVASRLMNFVSKHHQAWRLGGDEFAILLRDVHSEAEVKTLCASLSSQFLEPFNLHNGHTATCRSASAMRWHKTCVSGEPAGVRRSKYVSDETPAYSASTKIKGTTMLRKYFAPALMAAVLLTGCQAPQGNSLRNRLPP